MADISGLVLTALPTGLKTALLIKRLVDNYTEAHDFVHELRTQCIQTRETLAGMRASVEPSHILFHELVGEFDQRLETLLEGLKAFSFNKDNGSGVTSTQVVLSRVRAVMRRQGMMDMRQYILEKSVPGPNQPGVHSTVRHKLLWKTWWQSTPK